MSVINKMLRDLDQRQTADNASAQTLAARTGIERGTRIVNESQPAPRRGFAPAGTMAMTIAILGLAFAAAAWWYLKQAGAPTPPLAASAPTVSATRPEVPPLADRQAVTVAAANAAIATASAAVPAAQAQVPSPLPLASAAPPLAATRLPVRPSAASAPSSEIEPASRPAPTPQVRTPVAAAPAKVAPDTAAASGATVALAPASAPDAPSPALQALAQAQSLWNSGAQQAATDLLREAVLAMERAGGGKPTVLAALARELARMEMAQGQVAQALSMLTRLEPSLSGFADVWALRGNAAQRLGRHEESATAYLMALKLRPNEARWILGAAVSLAAQGQLAAAGELADKARASGALSTEVASYLRQLGVPLRER